MWFGAGFKIEFSTVEEAKKYKPEIEQFLAERMPNVWAGNTSRRKAAIIVPMTEDSEVVEGADDVRGYLPPGRQQIYSELFFELYKYFLEKDNGAVISAVAEYDVYDSCSKQVLKSKQRPEQNPHTIDYDEVFSLLDAYDGDCDAVAEELGLY